ncbi:hypothetical protein NPX13_g455 [Xylaria arbuscula]|uniref:Methyltransferase type 11 domain-containing protein n=1 Tax=Xylaria arbuscula TaxID=114810 RepID=A0A9W8TS17_9PEZI|nr:hypothetical protein NPX13_g455 [Xylaria arbuscula]
MAKVQEELGKMFKTFSSNFDDEQLDKFIEDSERIMRRPAELLLKQAGLDAATSTRFALNLVNTLKRRAEKEKWINVETAVLDAQDSGLPASSFSHVTINFAMHVIPDPGAVLQEAMRVLQPGGTLAFTVWHRDNLGWVPDMASCFEALPFEAPMLSPVPMAPNGKTEFIDPDLVPEQLRRCGFEDVEVQTAEHIVRMESAADYLRNFAMMRDWMMRAYWSEDSMEKAKGMGPVMDTGSGDVPEAEQMMLPVATG